MRPIARAVPWLAVVLALVLVGTELPVVHAHGGRTAGLYNEECSLERLATAPAAAVLGDALDAGAPLPALPVPPAPGDPAPETRPPLPSGSRAPPSA
jgi:hypothetical protein